MIIRGIILSFSLYVDLTMRHNGVARGDNIHSVFLLFTFTLIISADSLPYFSRTAHK